MRNSPSPSGVRLTLFVLSLLSIPSHLCSAQAPAPAQDTPQNSTSRIAGTIVNALDGSPLGRARISIFETSNRTNSVSLITSENGHFEFPGLKSGKFSLQGTKRGFLTAAYDQHEQYSTAIVTGAGLDTEHLVLRLTPLATLSGKVLDESGDPVRHAQVFLYRENRGAGLNRISSAGSSPTDDQGSYEFPSLMPGNYFLSVEAKPWYAVHPVSLTPDGTPNRPVVQPSLDVSYPVTYYNGATEADSAVPISVKAADHVQIDVQLNPVPSLRVLFHVPTEQNAYVPPVFEKRVFDSQQFIESGGTQQVSPGVFEVIGIPPGKYIVQQNDAKTGQLVRSVEMELSQNGQELDESVGELVGKAKLAIRLPRGEKPPKQFVVLLQDSRRHVVGLPLKNDDTVEFGNLPAGKYSIVFSSPNKPYSVARTVSNGIESQGHDLNIAPGASVDVTLFLTEGVTTIEGFAKRGDKGSAGVMVILVPKDPQVHQELLRRDQTDLDGSFTLRGVIPGTYTIVAVEDAWGSPWLQPDVLARYVKHGQNVTIAEMMQGSVRLTDPVAVQPR